MLLFYDDGIESFWFVREFLFLKGVVASVKRIKD